MVDDSSRFGALLRIVVPLSAPGIAATAIFAFVSSWSELLLATTFTSQTRMQTLSAGLLYLAGQQEVQWGQLKCRRDDQHGPGGRALYLPPAASDPAPHRWRVEGIAQRLRRPVSST
jgi:hypothetical protein